MRTRLLTLLTCCFAAACGGNALTSTPDGNYRIVACCKPDQLTAALDQHAGATMVVTFGSGGTDIVAATGAAKRAQRPFLVTIGSRPAKGETQAADVTIVAETGAEAAIELALLACLGKPAPPHRLELGTTIVTPANLAAGGSRQAAPGDAILAMTRMENAAALANVTGSHSIALIQINPRDAGQTQAVAEVQAATVKHPSINLLSAVTSNELGAESLASQLIASGCRAMILTCSDPATTRAVAKVCATATTNKVSLIVLDPTLTDVDGVCRIGCSAAVLGRSAASQLPALLPEGGALIACLPESPTNQPSMDVIAPRVRAFCDALGLDAAQLLGN